MIFMDENRLTQHVEEWYCHQCGADFRDWLSLPGEVRREFLRARPEYDIVNLTEERCPRCDASYQLQ
jgi:hypothetical protein